MKNLLYILFVFVGLYAAAQPANDLCSGAQNLGTLGQPGNCGSGIQNGSSNVINTTNVGATPENPYVTLAGCGMASPANSVWYSFTAPTNGFGVNIAVTNGGTAMSTPNIALWQGSNCSNLTGVGCIVGSGGSATLNIGAGIVPGQTYYIQVSGGTGQSGPFTLTTNAFQDCSDCLRQATLTVSPLPVNGTYQPGQTVTFCFKVNQWVQINQNWLHGIQLAFGPGWDLSTLTTTPSPAVYNTPGTWAYWPNGITASNNGSTWPPGFYFDTNDTGTDPGNNFGDGSGTNNSIKQPTGSNWLFCWTVTVSNNCTPNMSLSMVVNTSGDGESGSWTNAGCAGDAPTTFNAVIACCPPLMSATNVTCFNGTNGTATATPVAGSAGPFTYSWTGPSGYTNSQSNVTGAHTISGLAAGTYNVTITDANNCSQTASIVVTQPPATTVTATNATICLGASAPITASCTGNCTGISYTWSPATGLSGTTGATVTASPTATTTYTVVGTTSAGCVGSNTTTVTVIPLNTIAAGTSQTVCINSPITTINLATTGATGATFSGLPAGVTGSWAGNVATISGTPTVAGTFNYTVTTTGGCPPATATGTITVTPLNTIAAGTNQTVCINTAITTINLATTGATGATFSGLPAGVTGTWAGNVATISGTPTASGTFNYTVTTTGGCPPATTSGTITVTPLNTIAAGTNQTVCINSAITTINLATTGATGATFSGLPAGVTGSWAGNVATISGTPTVAGTFNYTVTTTGGCPPATTTGTITVTPLNTIAAGTNQTVCINNAISTINLATTGATGATFTGLPAGVTGTWAGNVATISGTPTVAGTFNYTVTTTGGCPPATTTGTITVNSAIIPVTDFSYTTPVCFDSPNLLPTPVAGFTAGGTYSSTASITLNPTTGEISVSSSTPGTYTITYTYPATTCGALGSSTFNVTITPQNTIAAGTNQTVCINSAITTINLATTTATGATFTGLPAGVTGTWAGNVATISGTPTVAGTFNYTVTTTGGCPPATATGTITVTPQNTIAAGTNQTVCINAAITTINLATTGATGATFSGLPAGVTGTWAGNVATISGTPTASGTFNYTVTTTGGCPPATTSGTITVTPQNTIAAGTNQTVCINTAITAINLATTTATGATFTGLPAGVTGTWAGNVATISGTPTVAGTFNYTVTTSGGCPPATTTGTITVTPLNTIAAGTSETVCINTAITTINLATTTATGATFTGLPAGVTGTWAGNVATISGTPTVSGTFNYTVTTTGGCPPATTTGTITVNPTTLPITDFSYTTPVCFDSPNLLPTPVAGFTSGGTYSSTAGITLNPTTGEISVSSSTPGTYTITYTYPATTCGASGSSTFNVTITPQNTIAAGTNQTVCINTAITTINLATTTATGATFTGLPAGVTGTWAGNVATISGTPTVAGTFNYTVTTTGGCPPATATGTITVTPLNTIAAGTNQTVCINTAITTINLATTGATGATFSGLPAGVTGTWAGNVATISGTPTVAGTFNYTVTTTGGCPPATTTGTITVTPQNTIAAGTNQTVCINTAITTINLATTTATGATFTGLPAGVTGTWAGNVATISGTPTVAGTFNYTVTTTGGCPPATTSGTITVTPQNTIAAGTNQTVCINTAITTINLATTTATGATFTGLPAGVTGSWAGNVATISGTPTVAGTFNYTVTTTGGCPPATTTGTITVTPQNTIAAGTNQTVCINTAITTINLATTTATGATFTGLPAGVTGTWAGNVATISGTPTVAGTFNYTVTTTGGCPPATTSGTITVTPQNTIAAGTNQTVCINTAITTINLATTTATGATFTGLPAGITGTWAGNIATISGTPTVAGTFNYTVTTTGGCPPATATGTITVTPQNTIAAGTNQTVCINTAITTINLATTTATGATFTGLPAGVTGTWVGNVATISGTPTVAGTFNYTVTTAGGCPPATTSGTITVTPQNTIAAGTNQAVCINTAITTINLATTTATGATFTGLPAGVTGTWAGNVATISGTPTVAGTFNYTVTTTGGCPPATATGTITVNPLPTVTVGNQTVCEGQSTTVTATVGAGGPYSYSWTVPNGFTNPGDVNSFSTSVVGNYSVVVTNTQTGCVSNSVSGMVSNNPLPIVSVNSATICAGASASLTASPDTPGNYNYAWTVPAGANNPGNVSTFTATVGGTYSVIITNTVTGCSSIPAQGSVTTITVPQPEFSGTNLNGCAPLTANFTSLSSDNSVSCVWNFGNGQSQSGCGNVSATYNTPGCYDVTLTVTTAQGCTNSTTYTNFVCVEPDPIASFTANPVILTTLDASSQFINTSIGASNYIWNFGDGSQTSTAVNPYHTFPGEPGTYAVTLIAISDAGCQHSVSVAVIVQEEPIYYVPNTFTPDNDQFNQTFKPVFTAGFDIYNYNLLIFNRWGEVIFESNDASVGWDGTYGGEMCQDGTYIWQITFKETGRDKRRLVRGHVNLLR